MEKTLRKSSVGLTLRKLGFIWQHLVLLVSAAFREDQKRFHSVYSTRSTGPEGREESGWGGQGRGRPIQEVLRIQTMFDRLVIGGLRWVD